MGQYTGTPEGGVATLLGERSGEGMGIGPYSLQPPKLDDVQGMPRRGRQRQDPGCRIAMVVMLAARVVDLLALPHQADELLQESG